MNTYLVREENMERLEKKLATIEKKCKAAKCSFTFDIADEPIFKEAEDNEGNKYTFKYFAVTVDGTAKYNGWRFVATLDHHKEGNVVRAFDTELVIPEKYKTCGPTCEHCNKIRSRKDTYLVYNDETQEFKQVGKSCLQEFTNGLSAEDVAFFCSVYEAVEGMGGYSGTSFNRYTNVESILRYAFECYKHWGYQKSESSFEEGVPVGYQSTKTRTTNYYYINRFPREMRDDLKAEMSKVGFNPDSEYAVNTTAEALEWIRNEDPDSEYIRNLKVICSDEYTDYRSLGILVSLTIAYDRHLGQVAAYEKKQKAQEEEKEASEYVGEKGDKLDFAVDSFKCISAWDGIYGPTFLYKFTDNNNNVYVWYASKAVDDEDRVASIKGTIKDHSEFNGVKQTVLTRCKVTLAPKVEEEHPEGTGEAQKALDDFFAYVNS